MTLAETQYNFKRFLVFAVLITFVYYIGRFTVNQSYNLYRLLFPKRVEQPAAKFGKLPQLKMTPISFTGNPEYILDVSSDKLNFPDRLYVYKLIEPQPNFSAEDKIKGIASNLGFQTEPVKLSSSNYRWTDISSGRTFDADAVEKRFTADIKFENLFNLTSRSPVITNAEASEKAINFLKSNSLINANDQATLYTTEISSAIIAGKLRQSNIYTNRSSLVKINVFRKIKEEQPRVNEKDEIKYFEYSILGPDPKNSLINIFLTGLRAPEDIPIAGYSYWEVENDKETNKPIKSDYYLSPINTIWDTAISQNKGVPVYIKGSSQDYYDKSIKYNIKRIEIRNIYIAYYERKDFIKYLQPIYVFEGAFTADPVGGSTTNAEGEIIFYYPAVSGNWVESESGS